MSQEEISDKVVDATSFIKCVLEYLENISTARFQSSQRVLQSLKAGCAGVLSSLILKVHRRGMKMKKLKYTFLNWNPVEDFDPKNSKKGVGIHKVYGKIIDKIVRLSLSDFEPVYLNLDIYSGFTLEDDTINHGKLPDHLKRKFEREKEVDRGLK